MPPAPIITATLNDVRYKELCEALGLTAIPVVLLRASERPNASAQVLGDHTRATNTIRVNFGFPSDSMEKLRFLQSQLVHTLLHETRHAWQYQTWGDDFMRKDALKPYADRMQEKDAEKYATTHSSLYRGLVRVGRRQPSSNFSKLGRHTSHRIV